MHRLLKKIVAKVWNNYSLDGLVILATYRDESGATVLAMLYEGNEMTVQGMLAIAAEGEYEEVDGETADDDPE
jgi:hypothetical protein